MGIEGSHRVVGDGRQGEVDAAEIAIAVGYVDLADRRTQREQLHPHPREDDLDDRHVAGVGGLRPGGDGHEPANAASTTARAACCTSARCSGPRKDSA